MRHLIRFGIESARGFAAKKPDIVIFSLYCVFRAQALAIAGRGLMSEAHGFHAKALSTLGLDRSAIGADELGMPR